MIKSNEKVYTVILDLKEDEAIEFVKLIRENKINPEGKLTYHFKKRQIKVYFETAEVKALRTGGLITEIKQPFRYDEDIVLLSTLHSIACNCFKDRDCVYFDDCFDELYPDDMNAAEWTDYDNGRWWHFSCIECPNYNLLSTRRAPDIVSQSNWSVAEAQQIYNI